MVSTTEHSRPGTRHLTLITLGFLLCVFAVGTAELLVSGLLPPVAAELGVSVASAGQTVTAYAMGVVIGGPLITMATARLPRKGLVLALVVSFALGCALCAAATSYGALLAARVFSSLAHSTLFALSLITVTGIVAPERVGRAIATVVSGLTFATLLGVPLGSLLGQRFGWRVPFLAVAMTALAGGVLLALFLPRTPAQVTGVRAELTALAQRPVYLAILTTAIGFAGVFAVLTYIVPLLTEVSGFSTGIASVLLLAYGLGSLVGNLVSGRLTDRSSTGTLRGVFLGLAAALAVLPFAAQAKPSAVVAVLVFGLLATATITPLQILILRHAEAAPTLAVAVNVSAFNLANALGAAIGGGLVAADLLRWNGIAGALLALAGLGLSYLAVPAAGLRRG
ncbi:MFS transporter [Pseudonocardia spinosispora]|uniref:MFS transporter n=1 Tax=Pseudonocardia spinosispora TaxID=103441 RepID=UPI000415B9E4|nr:MFS transporter [Pseudonocardia spinosispora]